MKATTSLAAFHRHSQRRRRRAHLAAATVAIVAAATLAIVAANSSLKLRLLCARRTITAQRVQAVAAAAARQPTEGARLYVGMPQMGVSRRTSPIVRLRSLAYNEKNEKLFWSTRQLP